MTYNVSSGTLSLYTTTVCLCLRCLPASHLFNLLFKSGHSLFESCFLLLRLFQQLLGGIELSLIHGLDVRRLFAPFCLQFVQFIGQTTVLSLQETHFLDVARKPLVQVLYNSVLSTLLSFSAASSIYKLLIVVQYLQLAYLLILAVCLREDE